MAPFPAWLLTVLAFNLLAEAPKPAHLPPPAPTETVVLLPEADGKSTGIVIKTMGQEMAVSEPYQGVELIGGKVESKKFTAEEIGKLFPDVMQSLPEKPRAFTLRFEESGTNLTAESSLLVGEIKQEIARRAAPEIMVIGHTDRVGSEEANLRLSLNRAEAVRDILVRAGVSAQIIQVVGRGELEPAFETPDGVAEPLNRRVEITVR